MKRRSHTATSPIPKLAKSHAKLQSKQPRKLKNAKSHHLQYNQKQMEKQRKMDKQVSTQKTHKKTKNKIEDYVMIDGNIYKANTHTERLQVSHFVNRIKRSAIYQKCVIQQNKFNLFTQQNQQSKQISRDSRQQRTSNQRNKIQSPKQSGENKINVQQMVKKLPMEQKLNLMKQLQKQLSNNPEFNELKQSKNMQRQERISIQNQNQNQTIRNKSKQISQQEQNSEKYNILNLKLANLQKQLNHKRQSQIQKVNKLFYDGQLTASQRKMKISGIDKVKDRKIKIINCTRNLFYTLLYNKFEADFFRSHNGSSQQIGNVSNYIDDAIKQLDSFSDIDANQNDSFTNKNSPTLNLNFNSNANNPNSFNLSLGGSLNMKQQNQKNVLKKQNQFENNSKFINVYEPKNKMNIDFNYPSQNTKHHTNIFENADQENNLETKSLSKIDDKMQANDKKNINEQSLLISPDKSSEKQQRQKQLDLSNKFECTQQALPLSRRLHIPLLLTKQKVQEMEWQKKAKVIQKMRMQIDRKISFQMGQLELQQDEQNNQNNSHFTTLADINGFIVSFYEYVIKKDLRHAVQKLNLAYGRPILDKLQSLQQIGQIDNIQYEPVLNQFHLNQYTMEMALTTRRFSQHEKVHNKAIFDSFNKHLNAYRPYYDLDGQVYPWFISEKGLTFYQINEQNIEQVFQKTKIKVLQQCSVLCGIIPYGIQIEQCPEIVKQKNNENFQKQEKINLMQNYSRWNLEVLDYDTMVRLLLAQEILKKQVMCVVQDLIQFDNTFL